MIIFFHIINVKMKYDNDYSNCLITNYVMFSISIYYVDKQKRESFVLFKINQMDLFGKPFSQKWVHLCFTVNTIGCKLSMFWKCKTIINIENNHLQLQNKVYWLFIKYSFTSLKLWLITFTVKPSLSIVKLWFTHFCEIGVPYNYSLEFVGYR